MVVSCRSVYKHSTNVLPKQYVSGRARYELIQCATSPGVFCAIRNWCRLPRFCSDTEASPFLRKHQPAGLGIIQALLLYLPKYDAVSVVFKPSVPVYIFVSPRIFFFMTTLASCVKCCRLTPWQRMCEVLLLSPTKETTRSSIISASGQKQKS